VLQQHYERYWSGPSAPPDNDPLTPVRHSRLWKHLDKAGTKTGRLLDIGCGAGQLCEKAQRMGLTPVGMDISSAAIERARIANPDIEFKNHSVEEFPWPVQPDHFDVVTSFEVIEHLLHPADLIRGAHIALRPGGYLALSTPYHGRIKNVAICLIDFDRHFAPEGDHIRFFSDKVLQNLLDREGFDIVSLDHLGRAPFVWANTFIWARKR
jgi:2-polyprenyl-3-methyl-5-hydroxy-6-metoxy-1,4-benzoquinol methylase